MSETNININKTVVRIRESSKDESTLVRAQPTIKLFVGASEDDYKLQEIKKLIFTNGNVFAVNKNNEQINIPIEGIIDGGDF